MNWRTRLFMFEGGMLELREYDYEAGQDDSGSYADRDSDVDSGIDETTAAEAS